MSITQITGIYQADGGLVGELRYLVGKLRGTAHCTLCDITHGATGKKAAFSRCEANLPLPLTLVHLNEREPDLERFTAGQTPCVVGHTEQGFVMLLDAATLSTLSGSVSAFETALRAALLRAQG